MGLDMAIKEFENIPTATEWEKVLEAGARTLTFYL